MMHRLRTAVKRAGIAHCTVHDLRRTFVSHLAMAGVSQTVTQRLVGHASVTTTERYYTAILPEALVAAPRRLPYADTKRMLPLSYRAGISGDEPKSALVTNACRMV